MLDVTLDLPSLGSARYLVARLDGDAELLAEPDDPRAPLRLLERVLRDAQGVPVATDGLLATWRDRLLAAIFCREFGGRVESRGQCTACNEAYEFGFALADVLAQQDLTARQCGLVPDAEGMWQVTGGKVRPPRLHDLAACDDPDSLHASLCEGTVDAAQADSMLEAGAPLLDFDIAATCPECSATQNARFQIGRYLIEALAGEHAFLLRETHLIASRYGWDHASIMALPRRDRQAYAALVESERSAALARRA